MSTKKVILSLIIIVPLMALACNLTIGDLNLSPLEVDELRTDRQSIEVGGADLVQARISMGAGELKVAGGADNLVDADFTYNIDEWAPKVAYQVDDAQGRLTVQQPAFQFEGIPTDEVRNTWDVQLNNGVPMHLTLEIGAGASELELSELSLQSLSVSAGAGETTINLASSSIETLNIDAGIGEMTVDLSGDWQQDLEARIRSGVGELTVKLPRNVGVRVEVATGVGEVQTGGLRSSGKAYVNDAYGQSDVTLHIDLQGGLGQINLKQSG